VPALAVADALRDSGATVSFLGVRERAEADLVPHAGYEIDFVRARGLDRGNPARAASAALLAVGAVAVARRRLAERRADVVMGGGGYVAGVAGLAAVSRRMPLVLTEADSHLGLSNRMLASRARRVCLAFPIAGLEPPRFVVTGRPVPAEIAEADRGRARERYGIPAEAPCLLVFGGSQGARSINMAALEAFGGGEDVDSPFVIHIAGRRDYPAISQELGGDRPDRYILLEREPTLAPALAACDLVVARAGGSIFELAAAGRPALLVPYPHASGDHQRANAEWMAGAGAAVVLSDEELSSERLKASVADLLGDPTRLRAMASASAALARPTAAADIAREVLQAAAT
jgi:UDP-N-acetylglucosamine--N-acetylmuramyl-(pentapeptide) pyrophosphoryl-undecaprenol N-acetylglucosamine transferase